MSDTDAILGMLRTAGVDVIDGKPGKTPPGPYVAVFDDSGNATTTHRARTARHVAWTHRLVCVDRTPQGLRDLVQTVRNSLTGKRPNPAGDLLMEPPGTAGPVIEGGPDGDTRLSKTLTYRHHSPRE